ncbi:scavenger receptor cysteine-rich domain superfamily protein-like isoform X2 [Dreissena polymorpha]|nr:scavenger receptor cysteine-rich domain superfamily protein-like isoform X2 [Dreissena polymorpha]
MLGVAITSNSFFMTNGYYGQGTGDVLAKDLTCQGGEVDIGLCGGNWWPRTVPGDHSQDVGVNCDGVIPMRINGDSNSTGLVEVLHNGDYGTVCSTNFDRLDLIVVCRMLGFDNIPKSAYWYVTPGIGLGEIVVSGLACNGIESGIGHCGGTWPAVTSCTHDNDVYVNCAGVPETVRLVDGKTNYSGRVEFYHVGEWGTICDSSFDRPDAVVICRILGFPHPERAVAHRSAHFGAAQSHVPIVMTELHCNGLEKTLGQCNPTWTSSSCSHTQDIGVDCCPNCQAAIIG